MRYYLLSLQSKQLRFTLTREGKKTSVYFKINSYNYIHLTYFRKLHTKLGKQELN